MVVLVPLGVPPRMNLLMHNAWHALDALNELEQGNDIFWRLKGKSTNHMKLSFVLMDIIGVFDYA